MSRVYEALRRAAEEGRVTLPPSVSSGAGALADDAFGSLAPEGVAAPVIEPAAHRPVAPRAAEPPSTADPQPARAPLLSTWAPAGAAAQYEGKVVADPNIAPQSREEYRKLAASLHHAQATRGTKVVMLTSALVGEGKSITASNLAMTLSESYQKRVLLIDADLRRPSLAAVFGLQTASGLCDGLLAAEYRAVPVHQVSPRLCLLPAGHTPADPIAALTSERMRQILTDAREMFDWVIVDTPPVALLTDANLLSEMTDGAVIVVKAGHTPWSLVDRAVQAVGRERTLGVVLNSATVPLQGAGYYNKYYSYAKAAE